MSNDCVSVVLSLFRLTSACTIRSSAAFGECILIISHQRVTWLQPNLPFDLIQLFVEGFKVLSGNAKEFNIEHDRQVLSGDRVYGILSGALHKVGLRIGKVAVLTDAVDAGKSTEEVHMLALMLPDTLSRTPMITWPCCWLEGVTIELLGSTARGTLGPMEAMLEVFIWLYSRLPLLVQQHAIIKGQLTASSNVNTFCRSPERQTGQQPHQQQTSFHTQYYFCSPIHLTQSFHPPLTMLAAQRILSSASPEDGSSSFSFFGKISMIFLPCSECRLPVVHPATRSLLTYWAGQSPPTAVDHRSAVRGTGPSWPPY